MKKELILFLFICPLVFFYVFSDSLKERKKERTPLLTLQDSFEKLQGSEIEDWNYIQTKEDYQALEYYKTLYGKNNHYQFNSSPSFKIPKTIHLIWIGPKNFPLESIKMVRTWMAHHPDWTFVFWTDRSRPAPCNGMEVRFAQDFEFQFLKEKFNESKSWVEKSDLWRYEILYKEGGVSIDHDAKCLRPFHGLHTGYDFYACLDVPHERIEDMSITAGIGVIGACPHHPVLKGTIYKILDHWDDALKKFPTSEPLFRTMRIIRRTNMAFTYALKDNLNHPGNTDIVFPASYFYSKQGLPGFYSKNLYGSSRHDHDKTPNKKFFSKTLRDFRSRDAKILRVELLSLFALIGCFVLYFLINRQIKSEKNK